MPCIPKCWLSVEDFVSEINRAVGSGVVVDAKILLQIMRVIYDQEENAPGTHPGMDLISCGGEILRLEQEIGE